MGAELVNQGFGERMFPLHKLISITHPRFHLVQLKPVVQLGRELGSSGKRDGADSSKTIVQRWVLSNPLTERSTLEVDDEGGNLLRKTKEVDSRVQQRRLVFGLEIDRTTAMTIKPVSTENEGQQET
jgi:hypothetical protein